MFKRRCREDWVKVIQTVFEGSLIKFLVIPQLDLTGICNDFTR